MIYYLIALVVVAIDQLSKWMIVKYMEFGESISVIDNFFYITSHRNRGAAWGILQGKMWFFYIITSVVIAFLIVYIFRVKKDRLLGIALGLMLGGAIGNFLDRILRQEVVDFFHFIPFNFPVFNVADSMLFIGVATIFVHTFLQDRKRG